MLPEMDHDRWMGEALGEAEAAFRAGEVPVGAVVVREGRVIGRGHNQVESLKDPTAHAEILAIGAAATALGDWRLGECVLYVTAEPCLMCAGAVHWARVAGLVFGVDQPESGAFGSRLDMLGHRWYHAGLWVERGVRAERSRELLQEFFRLKRHSSERCQSG
jgi:tRNA(adenine34) deaminase